MRLSTSVIAMKFLTIFGLASAARVVLAHSNSTGHDTYRQSNDCDKQGAVASENAVCSRIGIDLLKAGGNAADAVSDAMMSYSQSSRTWISSHNTDYGLRKQLVGTVFCVGLISACLLGQLLSIIAHMQSRHVPFWHWWWRFHAGEKRKRIL